MSTQWIEPALALFREACELPEGERAAFLDRAAGENAELRQHVEAMLAQDDTEEVAIDTPLVPDGVRAAISDLAREGESRADTGTRLVPETIGAYRIVKELGHGAQATVYLAEHLELHRRVALKVLRAPVTDGSSRSEQRFRREAEVTANIEHPNICSVYETGCSDGHTWIAMQYVPGATLAAHLSRQRRGVEKGATLHLPESDTAIEIGSSTPSSGAKKRSDLMRVVAFAEQAARALHVAHEHGLVHRDIKPGNLMVAEGGRPVVLDFGLAHTSGRDGSLGGLGLTRSQDVLGTPYYMAPEQLRTGAAVVDRRTDVYALGVTLFECLTGRCPFDAVSIEALYQQILTVEPPAPRSLNPQIPRDLEVVVLTALEKERGRRYQSALDFAEDLRRVRQYEPIRARPISTWGRMVRMARRHPAVATSLTVAVVSLVSGLVASLLFLQEAKGALAAQHQTIVDQYHDTSRAAARADVHGEVTEMKARLRRMAEVVIAAEDPDFLDRIRAQDEANRSSGRTSGKMSNRIEQLLRDALDLEPAARAAVGDLLLYWVRGGLYIQMLSPERQAELVDRAELHLEVLSALKSTDVRVVRARIMLLDALNRARNYEEARDHVAPWLQAERASVPADSARVALYESRLGASLLGVGRRKEARQVLERSVPTVVDAYPRALYGNVAMANLLVWYDEDTTQASQARAAELRRKLWQSVIETLNHGYLKHTSLDLVNVALGPSRLGLWRWISSIESLTRPLSMKDVTEFADRLDELRDELQVDDSGPLSCLFSVLFRQIADLQSMFLGPWHPVVERLNEFSLHYLEKGPRMHFAHEAASRKQRGAYLAACGRYAEAEKSFRRAVEVCPTVLLRAEFEGPLGSCLASRGEFEEAEWRLRKAYDVALEWHGPWRDQTIKHVNDLVRLYRMWGKLDEAMAWHRIAIEQRKKPKDKLYRVETLWQFGQLQNARATIENAFGGKRGGPWVRLHRARLSLLEGKPDVAIQLAKEAATMARKRGPRPRRVIGTAARRIWAQALLARGDADASLEHFELGAKDPRVEGDGFFVDYAKARVADEADPEAGRALLRKLTDDRKDDPLAWHARARFLAMTEGLTKDDRKKAVECAERANRLCNRRRAFVLAMLAEAQFQAGDVASARQTAAEVRELMAGHDAQWLSVKQAEARFTRYR